MATVRIFVVTYDYRGAENSLPENVLQNRASGNCKVEGFNVNYPDSRNPGFIQ
jgi:hypothetical protein